MSYYRICPNCGKGTVARYATDDSLCGECSDNSVTTDKLSVEKLQERCDRYEKALTEIYLDENETIIDPVFLFHQSQRIAGRALNELGENNEI